ncbi:MAG TPA: ferrochelatase [Nitrospiria bacterium]|nr:ferrochelatase [Nitrospiria bacterium]
MTADSSAPITLTLSPVRKPAGSIGPGTAVILLNLGGPDSLEAVEPFLYNLFRDPDVIDYPVGQWVRNRIAAAVARKRAPVVRKYYRMIGGKSPILDHTKAQAQLLERALRPHGAYTCLIGMRYWHPMIDTAVNTALGIAAKRCIILPLYPHYSLATTGSAFTEVRRQLRQRAANRLTVRFIDDWHNHPAYIAALADRIRAGLSEIAPPLDRVHLVFSAHGLPEKLIKKGDPYQRQIEETVRLTVKSLGYDEGRVHLCYQSRVGPLKWIGPSTEELIKELAGRGVRTALVVPVSFVSDHLETLYEIDILYKKMAEGLGISEWRRAPSLNDSPMFIEALKTIVLEASK